MNVGPRPYSAHRVSRRRAPKVASCLAACSPVQRRTRDDVTIGPLPAEYPSQLLSGSSNATQILHRALRWRRLMDNDGALLVAVNSSLVRGHPISATAPSLCASANDGFGSRQSGEAIPTTSRTRRRPSARGPNEIPPTGQRIGKVTPNTQPATASINAVVTPSGPPPVLQRWTRRVLRHSSMVASTNCVR